MKLSELLDKPYRPRKIELTKFKAAADRLNRTVTALQEKYEVVEPIPVEQLDEALRNFEDRYRRNDWSKFPWHRASGLFRSFFTSQAPDPDDPRWSGVATVLLNTLDGTDRKSYCRAAFEVYLETYRRNSKVLDRLREILGKKSAENIPVKRALVEEHKLLDPERAHVHIGALLARHERPYDYLKSLGVSSPHAPGLFAAAFEHMLEVNASDRKALKRPAFERVWNWLSPDPGTKLVASKSLAMGIDAIVLPFDDNRDDDSLRDESLQFLVATFGDPRVRKIEWAWQQLEDRTRKIVSRWLTRKSLKVFFDIIDRFEGSHMWAPRRKFWSGIDARGWIDKAWVVLNETGRDIAEDLAREHDDKTFRSHGGLRFHEPEKCFFIMKVGKLTIVEGTHDFAVRIFDPDADNAPRLFQESYEKNKIYARLISGEGQRCPHHRGCWETKVEDYMRRYR